MMLKIRQSYHGTDDREGYKFEVYNEKGNKLGELNYVSSFVNVGSTVVINNELYTVTKIYDSDGPKDEKTEVHFYELKKLEFEYDFYLGYIR